MTPVKGLAFGAAWDSVNNYDGGGAVEVYASALAAYASHAVPDTKLTLNSRAEYAHMAGNLYLVASQQTRRRTQRYWPSRKPFSMTCGPM